MTDENTTVIAPEITPPPDTSLMRDEQGHYSTARVLLWVWTAFVMIIISVSLHNLSQPLLTFFSTVYLFLATWAAGPRLAQYFATQISSVTQTVGQSKFTDVNEDIEKLKSLVTTTTTTPVAPPTSATPAPTNPPPQQDPQG